MAIVMAFGIKFSGDSAPHQGRDQAPWPRNRITTVQERSGSAGSGFLQPVGNGDASLFKSIDQFSPHGGVDPASQQAFITALEVVPGIPIDCNDNN